MPGTILMETIEHTLFYLKGRIRPRCSTNMLIPVYPSLTTVVSQHELSDRKFGFGVCKDLYYYYKNK